MSDSKDWDVEQYRSEYEPDEQWELKRKFLSAHKDRFSEDELICLAQVFVNVELLGCRYPKETMQLISELAKDISKEYREKNKNKLQRTFVKASEAASSKVKGLKTKVDNSESSKSDTEDKNYSLHNSNSIHSKKMKLSPEPFGNIILIETIDTTPQQILSCSVTRSGEEVEWKIQKEDELYKCVVLINSKKLAEGSGTNQKAAKAEAATNGLCILKKYYYTIKVKRAFLSAENSINMSKVLHNSASTDTISDDNIGKKLMKLMGWTGGGLGKSQQGIMEPVSVIQQINRKGLGFQSQSFSLNELKFKCKDILKKYVSGDMRNDLVFSSDFSTEERAVIHQVAQQMGLKSHSYGPKNQRTLVISRKINPQELVNELMELGGTTDKYELIEPTG